MKANAPEKIYVANNLFPTYVDWDGSPINTKRIDNDDIEYVRKDAFIKKAEEFFWERIDGTDYHVNHILKEFENYMKEE